MALKILIVEDEPRLAEILRKYIAQANMVPYCLNSGLDVVSWVEQKHPDLVLLDLMLPGKDGMAICQELRRTSNVPIIMVTARTEEIDCLLGLEMGADDYICKPFSPREVVARIKTVLRRSNLNQISATKGLVIEPESFKATLNGHSLDLTTVEFKMLALLAKHPGRIYSRDKIMDQIYSNQKDISDRTIDSHIKNLRKKIARILPDAELVHSVYGVGYKFENL